MISKKKRTRKMILKASYSLFARDGFNKITMKDVCDATGILYAYQGVRMWSCIVSMTPEVFDSITNHIKKQLIKE